MFNKIYQKEISEKCPSTLIHIILATENDINAIYFVIVHRQVTMFQSQFYIIINEGDIMFCTLEDKFYFENI